MSRHVEIMICKGHPKYTAYSMAAYALLKQEARRYCSAAP